MATDSFTDTATRSASSGTRAQREGNPSPTDSSIQKPSIIDGVARILDLGAQLDQHPEWYSGMHRDALALLNDWHIVGCDILTVVNAQLFEFLDSQGRARQQEIEKMLGDLVSNLQREMDTMQDGLVRDLQQEIENLTANHMKILQHEIENLNAEHMKAVQREVETLQRQIAKPEHDK